MDWIDKLLDYYRRGTEGVKIIYFCVSASVVYWVLNFLSVKLFTLDLDAFLLLSAKHFVPYIWTLLTFSFIHENIFSLFFIAIMLYFTERIFRIYFNGESFVKFFVFGTLSGAITFLAFSLITGFTSSYAATSIFGVYSILFSIISYNPKMQVSLFPLPFQFPIYILGIIILGLDIFSMSGHAMVLPLLIGRLGAAAFGFFYMKYFQRGNDFLGKLFDFKKIFSKKTRLKVKKNKEESTFHPKTDEVFNQEKVEKQKRTDEILEKISKNGYESLTKEEKDFLFKLSK